MKIIVKAKPNSREDKIEKISENEFVVSVKAPPIDGKANVAIIELLARYFNKNKSLVNIISGQWARTKVIEINDLN